MVGSGQCRGGFWVILKLFKLRPTRLRARRKRKALDCDGGLNLRVSRIANSCSDSRRLAVKQQMFISAVVLSAAMERARFNI
jgi:hypothetical protein